MPPLRELQLKFFAALAAGGTEGTGGTGATDAVDAVHAVEVAAPLIALPAARARRHLGIYAGTLAANFTDALRSTYPAIARLVGEQYFRQTVRAFQRLYPSRSGDLGHAGHGFPEYLSSLHRGGEFDYLGDIARLEALIEETLLAADHPPLQVSRLQQVPPSAYDALRFHAHPSLRLFESPYPALRIWEANVSSDVEPDPIDLRSGGDRLAMLRRARKFDVLHLTRGEWEFLRAIGSGDSFDAAVARGALDVEFDAAAALQRFVAAHALVDFSLPITT